MDTLDTIDILNRMRKEAEDAKGKLSTKQINLRVSAEIIALIEIIQVFNGTAKMSEAIKQSIKYFSAAIAEMEKNKALTKNK